MIYLFFEIENYKQLSLINSGLMDTCDSEIISVVKQNDCSLLQKKDGCFLFSCGDENRIGPEDVLEAAFDFFTVLENHRQELFGYNVLVSIDHEIAIQTVFNTMQNTLLHILETGGLWINGVHWDHFKKYAVGELKNGLVRIVKKTKTEPVYNIISRISETRAKILKRLSNVFLNWLMRDEHDLSCIQIRGPHGGCKEDIVLHVIYSLLGRDRIMYLPIIDFRRQDEFGLGPFASSIPDAVQNMKKIISNYGTAIEKRLWKEHAFLFEGIEENRNLYADNIRQDFLHTYALFLCAYSRFLKQRFLPCVIVLLFPEHGNSRSLGVFVRTLADLARTFRISLVSVSHHDEPHEILRPITKKRVMVNPFKKEEVYRCFASLYPGLKIPAGVVEQVHRLSRGIYRNILFYIHYLRMNGKIGEVSGKFLWVEETGHEVKVPQNPWTAGAALVRSLSDEARNLLFAFHWTGELFTAADFADFFNRIGLSTGQMEEQSDYLRNMQLFPEYSDPLFLKAVIRILESISISKTAYMQEQIHDMLAADINRFLPRDPLRLMEILAVQKDYPVIIATLPRALYAAIDENKFIFVQTLLKYCKLLLAEDKKQLSAEQEKELLVIHAAFTIKHLVAVGAMNEVQKIIKRSLPDTESLTPKIPYAHLYLALGTYYCACRELDAAVDNSKKAMHFYQELNCVENTAESFLELAIEFLARGNMRETLDYFNFAEKLSHDQGVLPVYVRALLFESSAYYLTGNFSRIKTNCEKGYAVCRDNGMRDYELVFCFISGRLYFDLGLYDRAREWFENALGMITLYHKHEARTTVYAWIARTAVYQNKRHFASSLFKEIPENPETLYFYSEALYFEGNFSKAVTCCTRALQLKHEPETLYTRFIQWNHGFSFLEGRCFDLTVNGTPLSRLLRMFRAFCLCKSGAVAEGLKVLHEIAINQKFSAAEPHQYLYYFFYYTILKSVENPREIYQESAHGLTILNKALKHLQERATTIDEPRDRIHYLTKNYWNILLMDEAKANKLL